MSERFDRGQAIMNQVLGAGHAEAVRERIGAISPDFADYIVAAGFGEVYARPGLSLPQRQLLNVGVLTAIGGAEPQLGNHIRGALRVGVTATEIVEAIFHVALYAGHPRAVSAFRVATEVFAELGVTADAGGPGQH
ncbi:carboxymuconolactone decarboxylase family protein [Nocardia sp. alder85J]|uniref:carboxymuconolactone decarboxylase family protein n=1 Tax=Nocardia sp. alder85J TaxID=2862949 RepID=UPI001CD293D4|nr:carboxymuconolactone decarboxylase family protein [Nocardia sp. alder85J]MCX4097499.1 carboxymuconolactone decarboxylase family protein [Nocardia sp. alder85J]